MDFPEILIRTQRTGAACKKCDSGTVKISWHRDGYEENHKVLCLCCNEGEVADILFFVESLRSGGLRRLVMYDVMYRILEAMPHVAQRALTDWMFLCILFIVREVKNAKRPE